MQLYQLVIVILGLLIIIVMNTALPAMNEAKERALTTYAKRLVQKAQEKCSSDLLLGTTGSCGTALTVDKIMGTADTTYKASLTVTGDGSNSVTGCVQTSDGKLSAKVTSSNVTIDTCTVS